MGTLIFLATRQLRNSLRGFFRSPRKLIIGLFFALIVGYWVVSAITMTLYGNRFPAVAPRPHLPGEAYLRSAAMLTLSGFVFLLLYSAVREGLLIFSPADVDFLFPTPVNPRLVLLTKTLRDIGKVAGLSLLMVLWSSRSLSYLLDRPALPQTLISWAALNVFFIGILCLAHVINLVSSFNERWRVRGRQALLGLGSLLAITLIGLLLYYRSRGLSWGESFLGASGSRALALVFRPMLWAADLMLVPVTGWSPAKTMEAIGLGVFTVAAAALLFTRREHIYEPAIGVSARFARIRAAARGGDAIRFRTEVLRTRRNTRPRLSLPPFGAGATALLWQSLTETLRAKLNLAIMLGVMIVGAAVGLRYFTTLEQDLADLVIIFPAYAVWLMAATLLPELWSTLRRTEVLKAMPISARRLALAQIAAPTVTLSAVSLALTAGCAVAVPNITTNLLWLVGAALPTFALVLISTQFIAALLSPNSADQVQNAIVTMLWFAGSGALLAPALIMGVAFYFARFPITMTIAAVAVYNLVVSAIALTVAAVLYARFEPTE